MLPAALVLAVLAAEERSPIAVVVASKRAGAEAISAKLATKVHGAVTAAGKTALDDAAAVKQLKKDGVDPRTCNGATECLLKAALKLGPKAVVIGVDVGKIGKNLAMHLEAVAADNGETVAVTDISATAGDWDAASTEPIATFVKQVTDKLGTPAVAAKDEIKRPSDAPADVALTPPPPAPAPAPAATATRSSGGSKLLPIIAIGAAGAALITSVVFLVLGMSEKSVIDGSLMQNGTVTNLTQPEFNRHKSAGNMYFTVSLSTALVGVLFGAAAGVLFATN